jgi:hypothetical protein
MNALVVALLNAYVSGEISAEEFKAWFIPATWDMSRFRSREFADMVRDVQLLIMEFSSGDRTEADLKAQLRRLYVQAQLVNLSARFGVALPSRNILGSKLQLVRGGA